MKNLFSWILAFIYVNTFAQVQSPQVPDKIEFGGMELKIDKDIKASIQKDVDALHRSPKHFQALLDKVDMHFAVIEPVLAEENVPNDFKYLAIQESSLIGNAVSSANAVGYWQFKKESATEVGLRVDDEVDERMNLYSATRGACKYLKRSNGFFKNWAYSLISYNTGFTGAKNIVDDKYYGEDKMPITDKTHWYLRKFLAYKVAFEGYIYKNTSPAQRFVRYYHNHEKGKTLKDIAQETKIPVEELEKHNHWLKDNRIPTDKPYVVIVPAPNQEFAQLAVLYEKDLPNNAITAVASTNTNNQPAQTTKPPKSKKQNYHQINGVITVLSKEGDTPAKLAQRGFVSLDDFMSYNDLNSNTSIKPNTYYFLGKKRKKTAEAYHTANGEETLWDISQKYGVRLSLLLSRNRIDNDEKLQAGRVVWLRNKRPKNVPVEIKDVVDGKVLTSPKK